MKLSPAVIGIENPRTGEPDVLSYPREGQVATIAGHELDNQTPAHLGRDHSIGQRTPGVDVDVLIAVEFVAERDNRS